MKAALQAKLLHVLQDAQFTKLGSNKNINVDVRVVAATNRDLEKMMLRGEFREDLYYRLKVIEVTVPPLRERRSEISHLTGFFIDRYARRYNRPVRHLSETLAALFQTYDWPGNIRELENIIERAVALEASPTILPDSLPASVRGDASRAVQAPVEGLPESGFDLEAHVKDIERGYIAEALKRAGGNLTKAGKLLGLEFRQVRYLVKKYNLK